MKKIIFIVYIILICSNLIYAGEKDMLNNKAVFIENKLPESEVIALTVFFKGGLFAEDRANNGIGTLFSDVWLKSSDLMSKIEFYGGNVDAGVASDYFEFEISMVKDDFNEILPLLNELVKNPAFDAEIFKREKALLVNEIKSMKDSPSKVAMKKFGELTYGSFSYGLSNIGSEESVSSLTVSDLKKYFSETFAGKKAIVSLSGNYGAEIKSKIQEIFNSLPEGEEAEISCKGSGISENIYEEEVYPRIKQAKLYMAYEAPTAASDSYLATKVLSEILGGGMSSYYFNILRQEKGYAYAVGSYYPSRICASRYVSFIGLDYKNVKDAIDDMTNINKKSTEMITAEDVENAKNYILGKILKESQSTQKNSWYAAFFQNLGLGHNYFDEYIENLRGISLDDVRSASGDLFNGKTTTFVLKPEE